MSSFKDLYQVFIYYNGDLNRFNRCKTGYRVIKVYDDLKKAISYAKEYTKGCDNAGGFLHDLDIKGDLFDEEIYDDNIDDNIEDIDDYMASDEYQNKMKRVRKLLEEVGFPYVVYARIGISKLPAVE